MNLGIIKAMKGKYADALSCYQKAMSYRKNYHTCMYNLGNLVSLLSCEDNLSMISSFSNFSFWKWKITQWRCTIGVNRCRWIRSKLGHGSTYWRCLTVRIKSMKLSKFQPERSNSFQMSLHFYFCAQMHSENSAISPKPKNCTESRSLFVRIMRSATWILAFSIIDGIKLLKQLKAIETHSHTIHVFQMHTNT